MKRVAETIGFLGTCQASGAYDFFKRMQTLPLTQREFIESNLCRFDRHRFDEIGSDIFRILKEREYRSRFTADSH